MEKLGWADVHKGYKASEVLIGLRWGYRYRMDGTSEGDWEAPPPIPQTGDTPCQASEANEDPDTWWLIKHMTKGATEK